MNNEHKHSETLCILPNIFLLYIQIYENIVGDTFFYAIWYFSIKKTFLLISCCCPPMLDLLKNCINRKCLDFSIYHWIKDIYSPHKTHLSLNIFPHKTKFGFYMSKEQLTNVSEWNICLYLLTAQKLIYLSLNVFPHKTKLGLICQRNN